MEGEKKKTNKKKKDKNRPSVLLVRSDVENLHWLHVWFKGFNEGNNVCRCSCCVFATMQMFQLRGSKVRRVIVSSRHCFFSVRGTQQNKKN